jgi:hypothetical protein
MAITYPLTPPATPGNRSIAWTPRSIVGMNQSPFTGAQQVYAWPGQWLEATVTLPPMTDAVAGAWQAFFLALNGREGTFYLGDSVRKTGTFAVGDWLQVGTTSSARLHRVVQVNSSSAIDVFPRLRTAYANGTAIDYTSPIGLFRLVGPVPWMYDSAKICDGLTFTAMEVVP